MVRNGISLYTAIRQNHEDDAFWERDMIVNPPGFFDKEHDVMMTEVELANWEGEGGQEYRPRPRVRVPVKIRRRVISEDLTNYEDECYDCD